MPNNQQRVAIVGAGLGGLVLARLLTQQTSSNLHVRVYEADAAMDARDQGGTLDIHEENGQAALKAAGVWGKIVPHLRYEGDAMTICGPDAKAHWVDRDGEVTMRGKAYTPPAMPDGAEPPARPEIDRTALRSVLIESLPADTIQWGSKLVSISKPLSSSAPTRTITFASGKTVEADLIVGADGAWSKVRPLLSTAIPKYEGYTFIDLTLKQVDQSHPEASQLIGPGTCMCLGPDQGLIGQRQGNGNVRVYACMKVPAEWTESMQGNKGRAIDQDAVRSDLMQRFSHWSPTLKAWISRCDSVNRSWPIFSLPADHRWERNAATQGVTILGDAAHLMPPSGEGANLAMFDAAELAQAIADHPDDMEAALTKFERAMFERSAEEAQQAQGMLATEFAPNAPDSFVDLMQSLFEQAAQAGNDPQIAVA